ncbi:pyrroline-5-carboxylate reductase [Pararhizobium sp. IMCC21322]|uniref:pyrroline-5-carboxylate reductase n=1 Tax=Pararhizobium sp. IMCC21322 TaxID=3067903 RepID=UPI00274083E2|nr:pyrroline-5-carboxylate reductase [Pararhizobium sp. IMCC21322]
MSVGIDKERPLVLVGAGKMGGAMLQGWLSKGLAEGAVHVIDPGLNDSQRAELQAQGVVVHDSADDVPTPGLLILAVKPQMMEKVLPGLAGFSDRSDATGMIVLSVVAGITIATLSKTFGDEALVIRSMPNTPALVGRGVTGLFPSQEMTPPQKEFIAELLAAIGKAVWVDSEEAINAVTAVSGSGPAYVFHLVEAMAQAGVALGLPEDVAMILARETVSGAGELLNQSPDTAETLRVNVTSPNGTTAAGLEVLMASDGLPPLIEKTVRAAHKRAIELGKVID